jgi:hypothetical protein
MSARNGSHPAGVEHNNYVSITPTLYEDLQGQIDALNKKFELYWDEE